MRKSILIVSATLLLGGCASIHKIFPEEGKAETPEVEKNTPVYLRNTGKIVEHTTCNSKSWSVLVASLEGEGFWVMLGHTGKTYTRTLSYSFPREEVWEAETDVHKRVAEAVKACKAENGKE